MNYSGQAQIIAVSVSALAFMIVLVIFSGVIPQLNLTAFGSAKGLIQLFPLLLVSIMLIALVTVGFKMAK